MLKQTIDFLCPVNSLGQFCEKIVFELYLIKYIKYRNQIQIQIQIQASLKSQIQLQIQIR